MRTPPPIPDREAKIKELLEFKKRWDRVELEIKKLRECNWPLQGMAAERKAQVLLDMEAGMYASKSIRARFPECSIDAVGMPVQKTSKKSGCLVVILVLFVIVGWTAVFSK